MTEARDSKELKVDSLTSRVGVTEDAPIVSRGDRVRIGNFYAKVGENLCDMRDSSDLRADPDALLRGLFVLVTFSLQCVQCCPATVMC